MSEFIDQIRQEPTDIFSNEPSAPLPLVKSYLDTVIQLYKTDNSSNKTDIDEVVIEGLDANQVWWQTKLILDKVEGDLIERIQELNDIVNMKDDPLSNSEDNVNSSESEDDLEDELKDGAEEQSEEEIKDNDEESEEEDGLDMPLKDDYVESGEEDEEEKEEDEEREEDEQEADGETKVDKYGLNDKFFDLEEFNRQTLNAENNLDEDDEEEDDEEIDYFADIPSEDDEEAIYYNEFFDKPTDKGKNRTTKSGNGKRKKGTMEEDEEFDESDFDAAVDSAKLDLFAEEEEEEEESNEKEEKLSTFERQQLEIQKQISALEDEAVAEKKWALKGEVNAQNRPEDALLSEDLEFDRTAKPVPVITSEVTESLEEMIRKRIQVGEFDDLERRVIIDMSLKPRRPEFELSDAKSSKSLAELYEADQQGINEDEELSEEQQRSHNEITDLFNDLCFKLDALSSAHFIPKPIKQKFEVRVETAAISMEDAQPLTMSSASTLAPQEIYKPGKSDNANEIRLNNGTVMSRDELTREDKTRLRRAAKRKRSKAMSNKEQSSKKKSKKDTIIETLSKAKNITVINKKGEHHDVRGNAKPSGTSNKNFKL